MEVVRFKTLDMDVILVITSLVVGFLLGQKTMRGQIKNLLGIFYDEVGEDRFIEIMESKKEEL